MDTWSLQNFILYSRGEKVSYLHEDQEDFLESFSDFDIESFLDKSEDRIHEITEYLTNANIQVCNDHVSIINLLRQLTDKLIIDIDAMQRRFSDVKADVDVMLCDAESMLADVGLTVNAWFTRSYSALAFTLKDKDTEDRVQKIKAKAIDKDMELPNIDKIVHVAKLKELKAEKRSKTPLKRIRSKPPSNKIDPVSRAAARFDDSKSKTGRNKLLSSYCNGLSNVAARRVEYADICVQVDMTAVDDSMLAASSSRLRSELASREAWLERDKIEFEEHRKRVILSNDELVVKNKELMATVRDLESTMAERQTQSQRQIKSKDVIIGDLNQKLAAMQSDNAILKTSESKLTESLAKVESSLALRIRELEESIKRGVATNKEFIDYRVQAEAEAVRCDKRITDLEILDKMKQEKLNIEFEKIADERKKMILEMKRLEELELSRKQEKEINRQEEYKIRKAEEDLEKRREELKEEENQKKQDAHKKKMQKIYEETKKVKREEAMRLRMEETEKAIREERLKLEEQRALLAEDEAKRLKDREELKRIKESEGDRGQKSKEHVDSDQLKDISIKDKKFDDSEKNKLNEGITDKIEVPKMTLNSGDENKPEINQSNYDSPNVDIQFTATQQKPQEPVKACLDDQLSKKILNSLQNVNFEESDISALEITSVDDFLAADVDFKLLYEMSSLLIT